MESIKSAIVRYPVTRSDLTSQSLVRLRLTPPDSISIGAYSPSEPADTTANFNKDVKETRELLSGVRTGLKKLASSGFSATLSSLLNHAPDLDSQGYSHEFEKQLSRLPGTAATTFDLDQIWATYLVELLSEDPDLDLVTFLVLAIKAVALKDIAPERYTYLAQSINDISPEIPRFCIIPTDWSRHQSPVRDDTSEDPTALSEFDEKQLQGLRAMQLAIDRAMDDSLAKLMKSSEEGILSEFDTQDLHLARGELGASLADLLNHTSKSVGSSLQFHAKQTTTMARKSILGCITDLLSEYSESLTSTRTVLAPDGSFQRLQQLRRQT